MEKYKIAIVCSRVKYKDDVFERVGSYETHLFNNIDQVKEMFKNTCFNQKEYIYPEFITVLNLDDNIGIKLNHYTCCHGLINCYAKHAQFEVFWRYFESSIDNLKTNDIELPLNHDKIVCDMKSLNDRLKYLQEIKPKK